MKKQILVTLLATALASPATQAADKNKGMSNSKKGSNIGAGTGLVVGGLLGGPPGAILSAALGAWLGDELGSKKDLKIVLAETQQELYALREQQQQQNQQLAAVRQAEKNSTTEKLEACMEAQKAVNKTPAITFSNQLPVTPYVCGNDLVMAVQFRTGSSDIESHYSDQLAKIVRTVKNLPELQVEVAGYADRRGENDDNQKLSGRRAMAIKNYLLKQGINSSRIVTTAYGETKPLIEEQSFENDFFDRRVMLRLKSSSTVAVSQ